MDRPPVPAGWAPSVGEDVLVLSMGGAAGKVAAASGAKGRVTVKACTHSSLLCMLYLLFLECKNIALSELYCLPFDCYSSMHASIHLTVASRTVVA